MSGPVRRVEQACTRLAESGEPVTFTGVAARAGIPRATLYRHPELRAIVEEHRAHGHDGRTLTDLAGEIDGLRDGLEAIAVKLRRHEEALRRLTSARRQRAG